MIGEIIGVGVLLLILGLAVYERGQRVGFEEAERLLDPMLKLLEAKLDEKDNTK